MFISSSEPLSGGRIRLPDGREVSLDESGQLQELLPSGTQRLEILVQGEWKTKTIDLSSGSSSMMVIDVSRSHGLIGSVLGARYRIEDSLGAGGMGVVYRATDTRLGRDVAIKMLSEQFRSNEEARRLFLEEARQMAPLTHPNLVGIHDVATIDGYDLMVTELVEGKNLDEILGEFGPFPIEDALSAAYQLTIAVGFLHQRGVIHRDLKPANAIRQPDGAVKLIDFGLARTLDHLVARGTAVRGTPIYMAPEQLIGSELTAATDIYQLGTTIYELLCDNHPIDISSGNILAKVDSEPRPLSSFRENISEELELLVHSCLTANPEDRPSAPELANSLSELYREFTGTSLTKSNSFSGSYSTVAMSSSDTLDRLDDSEPEFSEIEFEPTNSRGFIPRLAALIAFIALMGLALIFFLSDDRSSDNIDELASDPVATLPEETDDEPPDPVSGIKEPNLSGPDQTAQILAYAVGAQARDLAADSTTVEKARAIPRPTVSSSPPRSASPQSTPDPAPPTSASQELKHPEPDHSHEAKEQEGINEEVIGTQERATAESLEADKPVEPEEASEPEVESVTPIQLARDSRRSARQQEPEDDETEEDEVSESEEEPQQEESAPARPPRGF